MDVFGDYKYLFFMCGAVIVAGGVFLFVMNVYNYHMLEKEKTGKKSQQGQNMENQGQVSISEAEVTEPEAVEMQRAPQDP